MKPGPRSRHPSGMAKVYPVRLAPLEAEYCKRKGGITRVLRGLLTREMDRDGYGGPAHKSKEISQIS